MQIRVLGCSGGIGNGRRTTSLLVDEDVLIDAGTGVADLRLDEMRKIEYIFLTHSHLDHIASIPLLLDSVFSNVSRPITLYGRSETLRALREHIFNGVIWPDFARLPNPERPVLHYAVMEPGEILDIRGRTFELIPVNHVVPGAGYRVACPTGAFAFTGDTTSNDSFWATLNRYPELDLLFDEAAFADHDLNLSRAAYHYCPSLLAADLAKLRLRPAVYLSHLKPGEEETIVAECEALLRGRPVRRLCEGDVFRL